MRRQVLDEARVETAILCSAYPVDGLHNPDAAIAFARAFNDWQIAEWLDKEPRLRASIVVPIQLPAQAAEEIDRVGDHPGSSRSRPCPCAPNVRSAIACTTPSGTPSRATS